MNITELDSYNLADAVKFHNRLNPKIWGPDEHLLPDVRQKLLEIAADFQEFLGIDDLAVEDITISGSNAAYSYTPHSDIDLHLVVRMPEQADEVYQELFNAKKYQYNDLMDIKIHGADVELYVQPADESPVSLGEYSIKNNDWIQVPRRKRARIDHSIVKHKYEDIKARIESALKENDSDRVQALIDKIKDMRQSGLDAHGEFGPENLAFKMLRSQGYIKQLYDHRAAVRTHELSLKETPKKQFRYGFGEGHQGQPYSSEDGVAPTTCMFVNEDATTENVVQDFIQDTAKRLGIESMPNIELHQDDEWSVEHQSFGMYVPETHTLHVNLNDRHVLDILRTVAHELTHCRQNELSKLPDSAGETGSPWENEANALAGEIMRDYANANPDMFKEEPVTENASGYIPKNKKQARDPRWEMALSVDIKPGQVGKEANKLGLQTDSQGKPALLMKSANLQESLAAEFALYEQQDLFEINMGSKNLRREAAKTGAIAGMEFEMIVPNVEGGDDDGNMEADYSFDEGITSIQEAYDFFYDGDYNSRGDVTRLRDKMTNEYYEWLGDQFDTRWDSDESEFVYNYLKENASADEIAEILGTEPGEDGEYVANKQAYLDAADKVIEEGYGNYWYDQARESAQEDFNQNADLESDWLESRDLNTMQDIENEYNMSWPHWEQLGGGEASIQDIAQEFENAIDRPVQASGNYHSGGVKRPSPTAQHYLVEPDGSLEADDSNDVGLEFVSPPLPIDEILSDLNKVKQWAKVYGCYTNDSTGLHINISVPNYSRENLDFVKLALLMGDEYVLDLFGRAGNTYAKPAIKMVRDQVRQKPEEAERLLDKMKGNLDSLASKAIHSGVTSKYTSINTKDGHIEFRSPGGDWLDQNFDQIENTLLRFTVAMSAALNPEMYREEYLKKLYKLLTQDAKGSDTIKYFSEYVAGKIPAAALRSFVKQAQLERKLKKDPTGGEKYWWSVRSPGNSNAGIEVVASSKEEAIEKAIGGYPSWANYRSSLVAKPMRPYEQSAKTVRYEIYNKQTGNSVEDADGITNDEEALVRLNDYIEHGPHALQRGQAERMFGIRTTGGVGIVGLDMPMAPGRAATSPTGQWKIIDGLNREVYRFRPAENTRAKANELAALWARENNFDGNYQVEPAEEEATDASLDRPFVWKVIGSSSSPYQTQGVEVIASSEREAMQKARQQWNLNLGGRTEEEFFSTNGWSATPVRPAESEQATPGSTADLAQQRATPGTFTGAWKIIDNDGNEMHRFSGVGNNQRDANRVATQWVQNNGYAYGTEIQVVPIMS